MALLSFVESAPRAYRLKVGNADLFRNSTEPGTSPDVMTSEVKTALQALDSDHLKEFFFFDDSKRAYRCPHCLAGRNQSDDEREFVQFAGPNNMQCIVCLSSYSVADYKQAIIDYFGYLDPKDQNDIKKQLDEIS